MKIEKGPWSKKLKAKAISDLEKLQYKRLNLKAMIEDRTIFDLSEEEYEDYENNPENWEEVTENTNQDALDMMFPNGMEDDQVS